MHLRPIDWPDAERMVEWRKAQMEHLRGWDFPSMQSQANFIERVQKNSSIVYLAVESEQDFSKMGPYTVLAYGGFMNIDHVNRKAEMAFLGDPEIEIQTEDLAANLILEYGFQTLNLNRIEMETYTDERGELAEQLGMKHEGTKASSYFRDGQYHNSEIWAILNYDYDR